MFSVKTDNRELIMAVLPVICKKCGNTVSADPEKKIFKCPHCGVGLSMMKTLQEQHPVWFKLIEEENALIRERNDAVPGLKDYEKKPSVIKKYIPLITVLGVETVIMTVRTFSSGLDGLQSAGEVVLFVLMLVFVVIALGIPLFFPLYKNHKENKDKMAYSEITTERVTKRLLEISQEKQEYLKKVEE